MSEMTPSQQENRQLYWRKNLKIILWSLAIWAFVSLGLGIVFAKSLNNFSIGGYPLGFWFAQQGAIYTFLILIFFYVWRMNRLDREFGVDEE
jgi:putative solute:sodium symporter small subunit